MQSRGIMKVTNHLEEYTVFERTVSQFQLDNPNVVVKESLVECIDGKERRITLAGEKMDHLNNAFDFN